MGYYVPVEPNVNVFLEDLNPGSSKAILFLHGWPANRNLFEYQFNRLPGMGYCCIGMDTRGFGNSDRPWAGYDYDRLADDVRVVIEALQLRNITLAGHSMGGAIAIRYIARHNSYGVSKLALIAAAAPSFIQRPGFPYGLQRDDVNKLINQTYADRPQMLDDFGKMFFFQKITQPFKSWFIQLGFQASSWATVACAITLRDESLFTDLPNINIPTLILHGIHDKVCLYPLAQAMNQDISGSKLVTFQFSGHGLIWEEQDKFNEELANFIG